MIKNTSSWFSDAPSLPTFPKLTEDITVDIAIIGGGITGIVTAYMLSTSGKNVALFQKGEFTDTTTAYTTAFLTYEIDTDIQDVIRSIGVKQSKLVWQSHNEAIDSIESIVTKEKIDCDFTRCSEYILAADEKEIETLDEMQKSAKQIGFDLKVHKKNMFSFPSVGSLEIPQQAKFHPLKYTFSLLQKATEQGVQIYADTEVTKLKKGTPTILETKQGTITANHVIIATYDPFNHPIELFAHKGMYTSYVYEVEIEKDIIPEGLYLDQANPYHYFRVDKGVGKDRMILGGEDHRHEIPMDAEKNYSALKKYLDTLMPNKAYTITKKWDGPILEPSDGLAYIGRLYKEEQVYVAMGFSGNGMTYAHIAAQLLSDMIAGKKNQYEELYNPTRIPTLSQLVHKGIDYTQEFFGGAVKNSFS